MSDPSSIERNSVTWYSKLLAVIVFVGLVAAAFCYGIWYQKQVDFMNQPMPGVDSQIRDDFAQQLKEPTEEELLSMYEHSKFKVVEVISNPFYPSNGSKYNALYVVGQRGINDSGCGSFYNSPICYFFLESNYSEMPPITYVGSWSNGVAGFSEGKFKDPHTIEFTALGGDAGVSVEEIWKLDLTTGSTTNLSRKITDSQ